MGGEEVGMGMGEEGRGEAREGGIGVGWVR